VDGEGVMQSPRGAFEVGWYDFRPGPGSGQRCLPAADFATVGAAVFWDLRELAVGDPVGCAWPMAPPTTTWW
jgi:hypothetical protein